MKTVSLLYLACLIILNFGGIKTTSALAQNPRENNHISFSAEHVNELPDIPAANLLSEQGNVFTESKISGKNNPEYSWQNPLLNGNRLTGILHLTNDILIASGNHGTILKSNNGGSDWEKLQSPHQDDILAMDIHGDQKIIIGSRNGVVAVSQNQGQTWELAQIPVQQDIRSIAFINENSIIAVGNSKTAYISNNLGETWQSAGIPDSEIYNPNNRPNWTYRGIKVTSSAIFIGVDGTGMPVQVLRSTDGGDTWSQMTVGNIVVPGASLGVGVTSLAFSADGQTGYGAFRSGLGGGIFRTTNGGDSWTRVIIDEFTPLPSPDNPYSSQTVQMRNSIAVNADASKIISGGLFGQVLASTDNGATWYEIYGGVRQGYRDFHGVDFPAASINGDDKWIVAGTRGIIAGSDSFVAGSSILRNGDEHIITFRDILFEDNQNGIAVGFRVGQAFLDASGEMHQMALGLYYTTSDAGQTWESFQGPESLGYRWHSIQRDNNNKLYLAGLDYTDSLNIKGIIKTSDDNGLNWQTAFNSDQEIGNMKIWDSANGYAVTFGNKFIFLNEDGEWESTDMPTPVSTSNGISSLDVIAPKIVYVGGGVPTAGGKPYIFKSIDGGTTWDQVFVFSGTGRISRIQFLDGQFGMAGGIWGPFTNRQSILVTNDYGNTWEPVNVSFVGANSSEITAFNFTARDHIIAYGANGHIVESIENEDYDFQGLDFRFSTVSFHQVFGFNPNEVWLTGDDSAIIKYQKEEPVSSVPARFANIYPEENDEVQIDADGVTFSWSPSYDPNGGTISYQVIFEGINDESNVHTFDTDNTQITIDLVMADGMLSGDYTWRVVATNNEDLTSTTHPHNIQISIEGELSGENDILSFVLPEENEPAIIDNNDFTVNATVVEGTDITSLTPVIVVSEGATVSPESGQENDFTDPVIYYVTAQNGQVQEWLVIVSIEYIPGDDATLADLTIEGETIDGFDPDNLQYFYTLPEGSVAPPVVEAFANDPKATVQIYDATDIMSDNIEDRTTSILVTAEDQTTEITYQITFEVTTSVSETQPESLVKIFPNPANSRVTVSSGKSIEIIQLINLSGELVMEKSVNSNEVVLELTDISRGTYLIKLISSESVLIKKLQVIQ